MGPNYSISTACATSNFCILNAANHIRRGEAVSNFLLCRIYEGVTSCLILFLTFQDVMLCGGSDAPLIPIGM
jgi:3-oxoacyl-[acyl-carrier-protein] synthase II